ncbi:MAG: hemolysin family protein [Flavobacteriaceae bacterium]|jgi:putative hemolysin|nr:hemolysin family protein [Flavobacteriaceae bacterium]
MTPALLVIVGCLMLSAFFSGMEIAFVSSNRIRLALQIKQPGIVSVALAKLTKNPSKFIATTLVGNNIALVIYGLFMGEFLIAQLYPEALGNTDLSLSIVFVQTLISAVVILITAEFLPKVFFQIYANALLQFFALPTVLFYYVLSPLTNAFLWLSNVILRRVFKTSDDHIPTAFSRVDLEEYVTEHVESTENEDIESEVQIFHNALAFTNRKAREIMVPRAEITAVDRYVSPNELINLFSSSGFSKILVYKGNLDNVVGYIHAFDLFRKPSNIRTITHPVEFVPESMFIKDILSQLIKKRKSIAIVLDEYGGTAGMITLEDIVEELFGEIEDEHDNIALIERKLDSGTYLFSARLEVDYLNDKYKLNLHESDQYETLGGYIVHHTENIPDKDQVVTIGDFQFEIQKVTASKIELIKILAK